MSQDQYSQYKKVMRCEGDTYVGHAKVTVNHMVIDGTDYGYRVFVEQEGTDEGADEPHLFEYEAEDEADAIRMFEHITAGDVIQQAAMEAKGFMYC